MSQIEIECNGKQKWIEIMFVTGVGPEKWSKKEFEIDGVHRIYFDTDLKMLIISCNDGCHHFPTENILRISYYNTTAERKNKIDG
jgi:hypothetical protein